MANNCILDNGYALGCASIGGIEKLWIGTYDADAVYALDALEIITGATTTAIVYSFEQNMETAGLIQNGQYSLENGTVFYESILSIKMIELTAELRNTALALGKAPIMAVVKSNAGHYYFLGLESAGRASTGTASVGVAMGDMNGASLEFTFKSQNGAYLLDPAVLGTDITIG